MKEYRGYKLIYYWTNSFDHLATPIINFFSRQEVESWIKSSSVSQFELIERFPNRPNSSWLILARAPNK